MNRVGRAISKRTRKPLDDKVEFATFRGFEGVAEDLHKRSEEKTADGVGGINLIISREMGAWEITKDNITRKTR